MADEKKAAFGVFPQMKPRRSRQDPEAAKDVPRQLLRGWAAGTLGLPGDIEGLIRMLPGLDETPRLPTSEFYLDYLPGKAQSPAGEAAAGFGTLFGGLGSTKVARGALETAKAAGKAGRAALETVGTGPSPGGLAAQRGVIKMPGGNNWLTGSVEKAVEPLKSTTIAGETPAQRIPRHEELLQDPSLSPESRAAVERHLNEEKQRAAIDKWVEGNLTNYIKKQMATPEDPVRKLAERGVLHVNPTDINYRLEAYGKYPQPRQQFMATSDAAKVWEGASDNAINVAQPDDYLKFIGDSEYAKTVAENPWLKKVPPETKVYSTAEAETMASDLGFDHIIDVLREDLAAGRIRPEQLNKVSMEQAVRRTYEYDQELAKKMQEANAALRAGLPVYKEYPEKFRWIELNRPGAFASESEAMGHSVRGYEPPKGHPDWVPESGESGSLGYGHGGWEAIKSGRAKVYSLVDEKGQPHVTVEVGRQDPSPVSWLHDQPQDIVDEITAKVGERPTMSQMSKAVMEHPKYQQDAIASTPHISQIKGKQNRAPKAEYLPFVQDFVKSGKWSDVGDITNANLEKTDWTIKPQEIEKLKLMGIDVPEYLTPDERLNLVQKLKGEPTEGMKRGGKVRFTDNPDAMRLELSIGGFVKGAKAAKAAAAEQKAAAAEKQALKKASEVLGEREGHPLMITQTDRSKVGGKWLGGPGFSGLQHVRPEYKEAEAAWGVATKPVAKTITGGYEQAKKQFGKEPVVTTMIGTPTQHQSNKMVFEELHRLFTKSAKQGNLDPELLGKINDRLRSALDKDGKNLFPEDVNILSPDFRKIANTFDRRGIASNLMGGVRVGGQKGQIIDYDEVIRHTTDPALIDAPTGSLGNRLFTLSGNIIERPDLHPAFPVILQGEDLGKTFAPVPREVVMRDFVEKVQREKGRDPGYMDYTRGYPPVQLLTEELLTQMQKAGYADGGAVTMAEGGEITADDLILEERPL